MTTKQATLSDMSVVTGDAAEKRERALVVLSFAAIWVVWGSTYLAIRYAVLTIPPLMTASIRHLIGGAILFTICWSRGIRPTRVQWQASLVLGALFFLIGHGSLHWAEQIIPSGFAALLVATEPLWVAVIGLLMLRSRISRPTMAGLVLGLVGVALLVRTAFVNFGTREVIASIVLLLGALSWSTGILYSRSAPLNRDPAMTAGMSMLAGSALLFVAAMITGEVGRFDISRVSPQSLAGLLFLISFGSATYLAYMWLLERRSPVLVATHAYVNPIIAVLLGSIIGHETLTPRIIVSGATVVAAIILIGRDR